MGDQSRTDGREVRVAVARVAARMRLQEVLRGLVHALLVLGVLATIATLAVRLGGVGRGVVLLALGGAALATTMVVALLARPISTVVAASLADRALGLADRLTSAVAFLEEPTPSELQRAAIADAARVGPSVDAAFVVALSLPRATRWLPLVGLLVAAAALVRVPTATVAPTVRASKPKLIVEPDALAAEREAVRKLALEARGKDEQLAALAQKLDALLKSVDEQKISRAEVFAELAKLEAAYAQKQPSQVPKPSEVLAPMTKSLAQAKQARALVEALKKDDLETARKELDKLAAAAEKRDQDKQEEKAERELQRALDEAGKKLDEAQKRQDQERDKRIEQLKEEERRLKKQKQDHPDDEDTERRLQRNKRELERLEREKESQAEQRRQLQRLSKDLQDAAEQLRKKMSPEAMKKMAEEMGKMQDEIRKLESSDKAQEQIAQLKEMLRRAGRIEVCTGSGCSDGRGQGQDGKDGKDGKGGQKGGRGEKLRDFDKRAGGDTETLVLGGGKEGDTTVMLPLPMSGSEQPGQGPGKPGNGDPKGPGDGIGKDHDPDLLGDKTSTKANEKLIRASGAAGPGPSRSQTILEASERGFSRKGYGQVYKDYAAVVEEVMSQEGVPPGYRYYVKRYFQLIRPRE